MSDTCAYCGEGKNPLNPDKLDWDTLLAQPTWQCNDCERWNEDACPVTRNPDGA